VVESLQRRGVSVHVVSGDDEGAVQNVATKLGIIGAITAKYDNRCLTMRRITQESFDIGLLVRWRVFGLEDSLRSDATHVVESLKRRGVSVHVVSGDDEGAVQNVALCKHRLHQGVGGNP
jgi:cation transport ATPase